MNKEYLIKWNKDDYSNLRQAVNQFNKRIKQMEKLEKDIELPNLVKYIDLKSDILTRKQLNQTINSLNRIKFKNAFDEIILQSGEKITRWEYKDIEKRQPRAIEVVKKSLQQEYSRLPKEFKGLKNDRIQKLESTLKTLKNYQKKEGSSLRYSINRIRKIGNVDYEMKKAQTFRENFIKGIKEGASSFKNYKMFLRDLEKIKNPKEFYDFVKDSDTLMDVFIWYNDETGSLTYGSFKNNEEAFNNALVNDFGYTIDLD